MAEFQIKGADAVQKRIKSLSTDLQQKGYKRALGKAARIVRDAAKQNALRIDDPETGRTIAANITQRVRSKHFRQTGEFKVSVGVATNKGRIPKGNPDEGPKGNTPHWHLVEEGTERAKAQPFMLPALSTNSERAADVFVAELNKQIDKALK